MINTPKAFIYIPVLKGFQTKSWKIYKPTVVSSSKKPLKESPQKAEREKLA